eukprot:gene14781-19863_t
MADDLRWINISRSVFERASPFGNESGTLPNGEFNPSSTILKELHQSMVLVVGAGGLGCEILKDLALSGVKNIHVIDLDTIDISNLNRQFLFRLNDVGKGKAETAANFIMKRIPDCIVTPHMGRIQEKDETFYRQFKVIISGLDNIEARRWLNSLIVGMVEYDDEGDIDASSIIPLIDGGTEGLRGQARVIIPKITSCFECSLESFPPQQAFPMCTIAETPRIPEHCIAYVYILEWDRVFPDKKIDKDSPDDMRWIYERALERAQRFGIEGVTYFKTIGVVKNIIPAVASTNAVISALCVNEAVKLLTYFSQTLNSYFMYMGNDGLYSSSFEYGRKVDCLVCCDAAAIKPMIVSISQTLEEFIQILCDDPSYQLKKPSIVAENNTLYLQKPPSLELALRKNLKLPLNELINEGDILTVTDPMLNDIALSLRIEFK